MRLHLGLILAHSLLLVSATAAPVPKRGPVEPPVLTVEMMVGEWHYLWSSYPDGCIIFNKDQTYGAVHTPGSTTAYYGTWSVAGNVLTIEERGCDMETGRTWAGGTYKFDFDKSRVPNLVGVSNGSAPVKLTKPQR